MILKNQNNKTVYSDGETTEKRMLIKIDVNQVTDTLMSQGFPAHWSLFERSMYPFPNIHSTKRKRK